MAEHNPNISFWRGWYKAIDVPKYIEVDSLIGQQKMYQVVYETTVTKKNVFLNRLRLKRTDYIERGDQAIIKFKQDDLDFFYPAIVKSAYSFSDEISLKSCLPCSPIEGTRVEIIGFRKEKPKDDLIKKLPHVINFPNPFDLNHFYGVQDLNPQSLSFK